MARFSLNSTFIHIMRCSDYGVAKEFVHAYDSLSRASCASFVGIDLDSHQFHQASLQFNSSGLRFTRARFTLPCAFLAACSRLRHSFHRIFPSFSSGDVDFFPTFVRSLSSANFKSSVERAIGDWQLLSGIPGDCTSSDVMFDFLNRSPISLQKSLASKIDSFDLSTLKVGIDACDLARINSACDPYGNGWLKALPSTPALTVPCWIFRESLRHRLGAPSGIINTVVPLRCCCARRPVVDPEGIHFRVCPLSIGLHCTMHNEANALIGWWARKCGLSVEIEPPRPFSETREHPDVLIRRFSAGVRSTAIDFTFPCAVCPSNVALASKGIGALARESEQNKMSKYEWRCEPLHWEFIGAAAESLGALGPGFHTIIDRLAAASPPPSFLGRSWACPSFKSYVLQRLSIIIQSGGCTRVRSGWLRAISAGHQNEEDSPSADPSFAS